MKMSPLRNVIKKRIEIRRFFLFISNRAYTIIDKSFVKFKTKTKFELTLFDAEITLPKVKPYEHLNYRPLF